RTRDSPLRIAAIVHVFLPQLSLELRVGLILGGPAKPKRDDVIVAAVRNLVRRRAVAGLERSSLGATRLQHVHRTIAGAADSGGRGTHRKRYRDHYWVRRPRRAGLNGAARGLTRLRAGGGRRCSRRSRW